MWYVVQVRSGSEESMCGKCRQAVSQKICPSVFVPGYIQKKKYSGVWRNEQKVLFPGYLFFDTEEPEELLKQLDVFAGTVKPVCIGGGFYPIHDTEQAFLQSMMDGSHIVEQSVGYEVDGKLVVISGPLQDKSEGVLFIDRHKCIARLQVRLWGEPQKVTVGLEVISKLTSEEFEALENAS